jgi:hypothetical protein
VAANPYESGDEWYLTPDGLAYAKIMNRRINETNWAQSNELKEKRIDRLLTRIKLEIRKMTRIDQKICPPTGPTCDGRHCTKIAPAIITPKVPRRTSSKNPNSFWL